ncbi:IclR family transcriptional regulator [Geodermatophilus sp. YIM 151500]|uniref:IclR family transcriptional regulator n=1 Tax=Geodermatophilus sp. YIM 151500 TaxID=2984531 RepID=UPI0021E4EFFB|nr:IclR family transcriptional regulator [Geodermatophilus sp. YIM 151500]MCV2489532.1 IclR family transcriptional regulator [Geodermatophilus sp. YIM 151500]
MPGPVQSIERAAAVLELLSAASELGVTELAESLGLAKSTTHGILRTLCDVGLVDQDRRTGRYRVGRGLTELGAASVDVHQLRSLAANWLDALAVHTGEAVRLAVALDGRLVVVHHVFRPDDSRQVLEVDSTRPPHACALGKVLLANGAQLATDLSPFTRRTVVDPAALRAELATVRHRGYAVEVEERVPGEAGVARPVRGRGGRVIAAAGVTGAPERLLDRSGLPHAKLLRQLEDAVQAVTRELAAA